MLREYAFGLAQSSLQPVADFLAPTVEVPTSVGRYKTYSEKSRFAIPNTLRAVGGRAAELGFSTTDNTYNCAPHAIDFPIDNLEQLEESGLESALQEGARMIAEVGALTHERDVISAGLAPLTTQASQNWGPAATLDAVGTVDGHILTVIKAAAYGSAMGVGVLFGANGWKSFKNNAAVRNRFIIGSGRGAPAFAVPSESNANALLIGNPEIRVAYATRDTVHEGTAAVSMAFLYDSSCLIFARSASPTRRDPSYMKTFRLAGQWMVPGSYVRDDGRVEVAKFDWSEAVVVTNTAAAILQDVTFT